MNSLSANETSESNTLTTGDELRQDFKEDRTRLTARPPFLSTESQNTDIISTLWSLHADELAWLAQHKPPVVKAGESYFPKVLKMVRQYAYYFRKTWGRCCWGLVFLPGNLLDKISMFLFAFFSSWILAGILLWCIVANFPKVRFLFQLWSRHYAGGLTLANAAYPQIFRRLSDDQIKNSRTALSQPMPPPYSLNIQTRIFDLDVAKILFQCSAIMYEHTAGPLQGALEATRVALQQALPSQKPTVDSSVSRPGEVLQTAVGSASTAERISAKLHQNNKEENKMATFAEGLGIEYATVSELNSQTSSLCGCFWEPKSNYIIVVFKGTEPTEFVEWAKDFSYEPVDAGDYIRGFGRVHGGFMESIFPQRIEPGARMPYDTIRDAVRHTATILSQDLPPGTKINVWFTGHSLGTALASLVYARAINEPHEFGEDVVIRDAYLFATPIIANVQSVHAFHNRLNHDPRRMMWRVTNGLDVVATALPNAGDYRGIPLGEYNLFSFAHLGMEIALRGPPEKSVVGGNAFPNGTIVRIRSGVTTQPKLANPPHKEENDAEDEQRFEELHKWEETPILGRVLAHAPALYWYMLRNAQVGECKWQE